MKLSSAFPAFMLADTSFAAVAADRLIELKSLLAAKATMDRREDLVKQRGLAEAALAR